MSPEEVHSHIIEAQVELAEANDVLRHAQYEQAKAKAWLAWLRNEQRRMEKK